MQLEKNLDCFPKKPILINFSDSYSTIGGVEVTLKLLTRGLSEKFSIKFASFDNSSLDTEATKILIKNPLKRNIPIIGLICLSWAIASICKKEGASYVIGHRDAISLYLVISKFFGNPAKVVIVLNNSLDIYKTSLIDKFYLNLFKIFFRYSDSIVSVSEEMTADIKKEYGFNKIITIHNPLSVNITADDARAPKTDDTIRVLHIGRLDKIKNQEYLIRVFRKFTKIFPKAILTIVGNGEKKSYLEKLIKDLGCQNSIFMVGEQENVTPFIQESDFSVYVSEKEGFGRSLIESNQFGKPVLSHDYRYGAKEIIRNNLDFSECIKVEVHENGILTPYKNEAALLEGMKKMVEIKFNADRMTGNSSKYSLPMILQKWKQILV